MKLTEEQQKVKDEFLFFLLSDSKYLIIDGQGGTGKTYLLASLIDSLKDDLKNYASILGKNIPYNDVFVTSTTNKSCQAIREILPVERYGQACTIHRLLGLKVKEDYKTGRVSLQPKFVGAKNIENSIIFVDECSMINEELFNYINSNTCNSKVIFIGDKYQLPPVKTSLGAVYKYGFKELSLTEIIRTKNRDLLDTCTQLREAIKNNSSIEIKPSEHIVYLDDRDTETLDWIQQNFKQDNNNRILCYTNTTVTQYASLVNQIKGYEHQFNEGQSVIVNDNCHSSLQEVLDPEEEAIITDVGTTNTATLANGSKIDYQDVFIRNKSKNCLVRAITDYTQYKQTLNRLAKEKDWERYFKVKEFFCDLRSAEVRTVHKAQGSTFDNVLIDLTDLGTCTQTDLFKKLLYVAFSRAKDTVYLTGTIPNRLGNIL